MHANTNRHRGPGSGGTRRRIPADHIVEGDQLYLGANWEAPWREAWVAVRTVQAIDDGIVLGVDLLDPGSPEPPSRDLRYARDFMVEVQDVDLGDTDPTDIEIEFDAPTPGWQHSWSS